MRRLLLILLMGTSVVCIVPSAVPAGTDCLFCHGREGKSGFIDRKVLEESVHAAIACESCHVNIAPYPHGGVSRVICGVCHSFGREGAPDEPAREYKLSVHGKSLAAGSAAAPDCQTCHGSHGIYRAGDPRSRTLRQKIPSLCSLCHPREAEEYGGSVHGKAFAERGNPKAPTCFDCHREHRTPPAGNEQWMLALVSQCGECHAAQLRTYRKTYHGKVTQLGSATAAKCADCHGGHTVMPMTDSASPLSERNILSTCRKCHPGATAGFTRFYAHPDEHNREKYPIIFYTYLFMTTLLAGVFAFFLTHTFLWTFRALKERIRRKEGE